MQHCKNRGPLCTQNASAILLHGTVSFTCELAQDVQLYITSIHLASIVRCRSDLSSDALPRSLANTEHNTYVNSTQCHRGVSRPDGDWRIVCGETIIWKRLPLYKGITVCKGHLLAGDRVSLYTQWKLALHHLWYILFRQVSLSILNRFHFSFNDITDRFSQASEVGPPPPPPSPPPPPGHDRLLITSLTGAH